MFLYESILFYKAMITICYTYIRCKSILKSITRSTFERKERNKIQCSIVLPICLLRCQIPIG